MATKERRVTRGTTCHYPRCTKPISTKYGLLCQRHEASYRQGDFRLRGLRQEMRDRAANARAARQEAHKKRTAPRRQQRRRPRSEVAAR